MVDIPIYRQQVRQAPAADTRLGLRATPDAMGAAIGEGVMAMGRAAGAVSGVADRIAAEERQKQRASNMASLSAQSTEIGNELQLAFQSHKLGRAVELREGFAKKYTERLDSLAKDIADPETRQAFTEMRTRQEVGFRAAIAQHAFAEGQRDQDINLNLASAAEMRAIEINADPALGEEGLAQIAEHLANLQRINAIAGVIRGLNANQVAELNRQNQAQTHAAVINTWNEAGHTVAAKAYFDQHKDELEPKARDALSNALEIGVTKTLAQQKSAAIYSPDKTLEAMFAEADQITDQKVQAETKRRLEERDGLRRRAIEQVQDKTFNAAYEKVKGDPRGFDALTAGERTAMGPEREERLKAWTLRRAKGEPLPWQASKAARYQLEQAAANPATRDAFSKGNLLDYIDRLNEDDFNALSKLQKDLRDGKAGGADWLNTREEKVNQALAGLGIDPKPYSTKKNWRGRDETVVNPQAIAFRAAVMQEAGRRAADGKRETPSDDDVQKAIDATIMKKVRMTSNEWWTAKMFDVYESASDDEKIALFVPAKDRGDAYVPIEQIPANHNALIRAAIAAKGREATDDQVQRAYAAALTGDRALYESVLQGK